MSHQFVAPLDGRRARELRPPAAGGDGVVVAHEAVAGLDGDLVKADAKLHGDYLSGEREKVKQNVKKISSFLGHKV